MGTPAFPWRRLLDDKPSGFSGWAVFLLLWPCSLLFRLAVRFRTFLYGRGVLTPYHSAVPVVSVGNLTVGGTGKTPVTDYLVKRLLARGLRVAVVSRGYGGSYAGPVGTVALGDGRLLMPPREAGDEPCLLASRNPALLVFVAGKRADGVRAAEAAGVQIILLDDGFQHLAVHRDFDIVLLDSRAPFGNGQLLPAGPLREPPAALRRADLVIMTHAAAPVTPPPAFPGPVLHCRHRLADTLLTLDGSSVPWATLDREPFLAFAGIARPDDFFAALVAKGAIPAVTLPLNDHYTYADDQLKQLIHSCHNYKLSVTTEKDAIKLRGAALPWRCLVAPMAVTFDEPGNLEVILARIVERVK